MAHKSFHLQKRPTIKKNKFIYYVQFYDEYGNRLTARSSGQTSKAAAEVWAVEQIKKGTITNTRDITFGKYAENWWIWDQCRYVKNQLARGKRLSRRYIDEMRSLLDNYILPFFKNRKLRQISRSIVYDWLLKLREKPGRSGNAISPATVNRAFACLRIMMNQAEEWEYIQKTPLKKNMLLAEKPKERGIFTTEEVKELFKDESIETVWDGNLQHFVGNLLPLTTGMRQGEVLGLQVQHVFEDHVAVLQSWSKKYGLNDPKWNSKRLIPIPLKTSKYLSKLIQVSPYQGDDDFVFYGRFREKPLNGKTLLRNLYRALEKIGIDEDERKRRVLCYHSWRHTFNSFMRGKIHDSKLQRLTGHRR